MQICLKNQYDAEIISISGNQGFTRMSNDLMDAACRVRMSGAEWQIFTAILRKTAGYNKPRDAISLSQFVELTGLAKPRIIEAIKRLVARNMLIITEKRNGIAENRNAPIKVYEIQADTPLWLDLRKQNCVTEKRNPSLRKSVPTKDNATKYKKQITSSENAAHSSDLARQASPKHPDAAIQTPKGGKWGTAEDLSVAHELFAMIRAFRPSVKTPSWADWANDVRLLRQIDGKPHEKILGLFRWANAHHFWRSNILSPGKLREKWDTLADQANAEILKKAARRPHGVVL